MFLKLGGTALIEASAKGHIKIVQTFLAHPLYIEVNLQDEVNYSFILVLLLYMSLAVRQSAIKCLAPCVFLPKVYHYPIL